MGCTATLETIQREQGLRLGWPEWRECAILASGPSIKKANVELLRGRLPVLAIKETIGIAPWADVVYGCDAPWWAHRRGLPEFKGLKLAYHHHALDRFSDLRRVEIPDKHGGMLLLDKIGAVGAGGAGQGNGGGHSGFQALNLAVQFGAKRILLVGYDLSDRGGVHFYGRNNWSKANNPASDQLARWAKTMDGLASQLKEIAVEVLNASRDSAMRAFRKVTIEQALREWSLH